MLSAVGSSRSLSGSHTDENTNFPAGPLIHNCFIKNLGRRVVSPGAFIDKDVLANLNWLEGKASR
jgi:hypothetical protein